MRSPHRIVLALLAAIWIPASASATTADETRFFDAIGRHEYDAGRYGKALEAFLLVNETSPSPRLLFNIAVCAELDRQLDVAFAYYREYLAAEDPALARRQQAEERATRLQGKLALLEIVSDPPGAAIYVDRKDLGQYGVTPRTIVVSEGAHQVTLELGGYAIEAVPAVARKGSSERVRASLQPLFGNVTMEVTPALAKLEFVRDDKPVAVEVVAGSYKLPVGSYTVLASAPGYAPARGRVSVRHAETARLALELTPQRRPTGRLLVTTGKITADLLVDGKRVAVTPATVPRLGVGEHVIEVRAEKRSTRRTVRITEGRATYVEIDLAGGT